MPERPVIEHRPEVAVLACSDARVPPSYVFDRPAGSLFVVRLAGNTASPEARASLDYAVSELGIDHVVVLGHTHCGAVAAAAAGTCGGHLEPILRPICELARRHPGADVAELERLNIVATDVELRRHDGPVGDAARSGALRISAMLFDLESGELDDLTAPRRRSLGHTTTQPTVRPITQATTQRTTHTTIGDNMSTPTIPDADVIGVATMRQLLHDDPSLRILDVRTGGEFESVHIPGSYNVPLDTLAEHAGDLADVEHPVVLVCQSGGRATQAHGALRSAGKQRLHILEGGMTAWRSAGGDVVESASGRWAMDRQVRLVAGSLVLAGLVASVAVPKAKWLAGGVASGLVYSALSNTCAMGDVLAKLPYNRSDACDIAGVLDELRLAA